MSSAKRQLRDLVIRWDSSSSENFHSQRLLDELLFHAEVRFAEYVQYQQEGAFAVRLQKWLGNLSDDRLRRTLFQLLQWLMFIDRRQMRSLYRDAYRRVIVSWICDSAFNASSQLSEDYETRLRERLREYTLFSITESFNFPEFQQVNDLHGLARPRPLGPKIRTVAPAVAEVNPQSRGFIVLEDFVGTGDQAKRILLEIRRVSTSTLPVIFIPLIILERGFKAIQPHLERASIHVEPIFLIPRRVCIEPTQTPEEPHEFLRFRSLIEGTKRQVLRRLNKHDDPPDNAFGYKGSGALLVTAHNTPNNSLPLIHHRAPAWSPLFRRLHHAEEDL